MRLISLISFVAFGFVSAALRAETYSYKTATPQNDPLLEVASLSASGNDGYLFAGPYMMGSVARDLLVKGAPGGPFIYMTTSLYDVGSVQAVADYNAQGARGYRLVGPFYFGGSFANLFVHRADGAQFAYSVVGVTPAYETIDGMRRLLNEHGAKGERYVGAFYFRGASDEAFLFEKQVSAGTAYRYEMLQFPSSATPAQRILTVNQEGARGFRDGPTYVFTDGMADICERVEGTNQAYSYSFAESQGSETTILAQMNAKGAEGYTFVSDVFLGQGDIRSVYEKLGPVGKVAGEGAEIGSDIHHANGNVFDQILISGGELVFSADANQITRASYVDKDDDIVQIEFSGHGTVSVTLDQVTAPALPVKYNQTVMYVKGTASIVIDGADETSNLSVFTVGRVTAVNQALFRSDVTYGGRADIARLEIHSVNGKFGGIRCANTVFSGSAGDIGINASGVTVVGPVFVADVKASGTATPVLRVVGADFRITGGDLAQPNGKAILASLATPVPAMTGGSDSHGIQYPAQPLRGTFQRE